VEPGDEVTPYYDPMIAKVIARGETRDEALDRLSAALGETLVAGPKTNTAFLRALCDAPGFRSGEFDTGFIDRNLADLGAVPRAPDEGLVAAAALRLVEDEAFRLASGAAARVDDAAGPWWMDDGFQLLGMRRTQLALEVDGETRDLELAWGPEGPSLSTSHAPEPDDLTLVETPDALLVLSQGRQTSIRWRDPFAVDLEHLDTGGTVKAPMHGKLIAVFVQPGEAVHKGQRLAIVEAMKMEHALTAPRDGTIAEVLAEAGTQVAENARLITLAEAE
jgi:3-methylcrotonyl-CoA carboxylase alpha subunit